MKTKRSKEQFTHLEFELHSLTDFFSMLVKVGALSIIEYVASVLAYRVHLKRRCVVSMFKLSGSLQGSSLYDHITFVAIPIGSYCLSYCTI